MATDKSKKRPPQDEPDEPETYELAESVDEEPPPQRSLDPRLMDHDLGAADDETAGGNEFADDSRPKLMQGIPEPKFVDPQVQAMRREEQRLKAAEALAAEEARKKKTRLTIWAVILGLVALAALYYFFLF